MARKKGRDVHGWLVVDKPAGISSSAAVGRARWALDAKKAGHAGTLDPDATGVLAVAVGEATKTVPAIMDAVKTYRFRVAWGAETTTDDAGGEVTATSALRPDRAAVEAALPAFRGAIMQVPPQVSAVKVDGARAYARARAGEAMDLAARPLTVEALEILAADDAGVELEMRCGKGGYVRSVARDLGQALGCLGHAAWLRRTRSGPFDVADAVAWDDVERLSRTPDLDARLLPLEVALGSMTELPCDAAAAERLRHGNPAPVLVSAPWGETAWASCEGRAVALGVHKAGALHPTRVLNR